MDTTPTNNNKYDSKFKYTSRYSVYLAWTTRFAALVPTFAVWARVFTLLRTRWAREAAVDVADVSTNQRTAALFSTRTVDTSIETFTTGPFAEMLTVKCGLTRFQTGVKMGLNLVLRRNSVYYSIKIEILI